MADSALDAVRYLCMALRNYPFDVIYIMEQSEVDACDTEGTKSAGNSSSGIAPGKSNRPFEIVP